MPPLAQGAARELLRCAGEGEGEKDSRSPCGWGDAVEGSPVAAAASGDASSLLSDARLSFGAVPERGAGAGVSSAEDDTPE